MTGLDDDAVARLARAAVWPDLPPRYEVVRELGRGGMGAVWLAKDHGLGGREVAVKVTNAAGAHAELDRRLATEAAVLAGLEHPGIVPVHDVGALADGRTFYVMKRVDGVTLERHLAAVPGLFERLRLFERICEPVAFAHARGVVHRDLKPSNVMVGSFGEVLVLDWGVAKQLGAKGAEGAKGAKGAEGAEGVEENAGAGDTGPGVVVGTAGYMAPEQAAGGPVDRRADVYALGTMLRGLLEGLPVPRRLAAIVRRATAAAAADRYPDAAALRDDVTAFLSGAPVAAYQEAWWERAARRLAPFRVAILLVVAYLIMRVLVAIVFRM